ncbi:hypothetical protein [Octadecabacter dasysiphoniae]|nr:hypothetical protein [Octadecabacter dasysiphoniae]
MPVIERHKTQVSGTIEISIHSFGQHRQTFGRKAMFAHQAV